jgi:hypothetical protein
LNDEEGVEEGDDVADWLKGDEENLVGSNNCMIATTLEEITCYVEFTKKLLLEVQEQECFNKKMQEDILYTNMKSPNQMEDRKNNLKNAKEKMQDLCMQLKGSSNPMICDELKKVETQ